MSPVKMHTLGSVRSYPMHERAWLTGLSILKLVAFASIRRAAPRRAALTRSHVAHCRRARQARTETAGRDYAYSLALVGRAVIIIAVA